MDHILSLDHLSHGLKLCSLFSVTVSIVELEKEYVGVELSIGLALSKDVIPGSDGKSRRSFKI